MIRVQTTGVCDNNIE